MNSLVDINSVNIDLTKPKESRIKSYLEQIQNPYEYRDKEITVKLSFNENGDSLECCLLKYLQSV